MFSVTDNVGSSIARLCCKILIVPPIIMMTLLILWLVHSIPDGFEGDLRGRAQMETRQGFERESIYNDLLRGFERESIYNDLQRGFEL